MFGVREMVELDVWIGAWSSELGASLLGVWIGASSLGVWIGAWRALCASSVCERSDGKCLK